MQAIDSFPFEVDGEKIVFVRGDGTPCQNKVVGRDFLTENGEREVHFFELLGLSGLDGIPKLKVRDGDKERETYRRLIIRQVFPVVGNRETGDK